MIFHGLTSTEATDVFKLQSIFFDAAGSNEELSNEIIAQIVAGLRRSRIANMALANHKAIYVVWYGVETGVFLTW